MSSLPYYLFSFTLLVSFFFVFATSLSHSQAQTRFLGRRSLLDANDDDDFLVEVVPRKKKSSSSLKDETLLKKNKSLSTSSSKNQTKVIIKPKTSNLESKSSKKDETKVIINPKTSNLDSKSSKKDDTKLIIKPSLSTSSKNKTKLIKSTSKNDNSTSKTPTITKTNLNKKVNSTSKSPNPTKKSLDPKKSNPPSKNQNQTQNQNQKQKSPSLSSPKHEDDGDLISEFRDLPTKFQQSFIPDLHRISTTSKIYINKYNKEFTNGFKPYVGNKYAPGLATAISCAFIIIPFLLVTLIFNKIKTYFSLQKLIIFIQIYLSIYFTILCISTLVTGLEPLKLFYVTSQFTYVWLQVLQTLFYVLYLLLLIMYLILIFSTKSDMGQKLLGLAQTLVGFAVGLHYYMTVFHRVVLRQPPKSSWKIHGVYATCFLVICLFSSLERRKKAYLVEGSEEGKTS